MILRYFLIFTLAICFSTVKAQSPLINMAASGSDVFVSSIYFPESNITICLTKRGNIADAYLGNSRDLNDQSDDEFNYLNSLEGIKKNVGDLNVTYYDNFDWDELRGKIKSIGNFNITYYDRFGWDETKGKIKSIGEVNFTYYDRFGWDETKGKLKSIGKFEITYYDRFDWDELKGKMKTIGNTSFIYHDRFGLSYKQGRLKAINGTTDNINMLRLKSRLNDF